MMSKVVAPKAAESIRLYNCTCIKIFFLFSSRPSKLKFGTGGNTLIPSFSRAKYQPVRLFSRDLCPSYRYKFHVIQQEPKDGRRAGAGAGSFDFGVFVRACRKSSTGRAKSRNLACERTDAHSCPSSSSQASIARGASRGHRHPSQEDLQQGRRTSFPTGIVGPVSHHA